MWYAIVDTLAQGKIWRHEDIFRLPITHTLNHLIYLKLKHTKMRNKYGA